MDSVASPAANTELVALQAQLSVLSELSRELQNVRSYTRSLLQPHSHEARKTLGSLQDFSASIVSSETQRALSTASARECEDGSEVDDYRRVLTKPSIVPRR